MRLEAHDSFGNLINTEITRVVVYDDYDNPIAVTFKYDEKNCFSSKVTDEDFPRMLALLGINKLVKVSKMALPGIKDASNDRRSIFNQ